MIINEKKNRTEEYMYMLLLFTKINVYIGKKIYCAYSMCVGQSISKKITNRNSKNVRKIDPTLHIKSVHLICNYCSIRWIVQILKKLKNQIVKLFQKKPK